MGFFAKWVHTHMLDRPRRVPAKFRSTVQRMLDELEGNRLDVVCTPSLFPEIASRGGMIRTVQGQNTPWYREYCLGWATRRKVSRRKKHHDTRIKRRETILALRGLLGRGTRAAYTNDLLAAAVRWKRLWAEEERQQTAYYRKLVKEKTKVKATPQQSVLDNEFAVPF